MKQIIYSNEEAERIQNWGEQASCFHNAEMKRWRKIWKSDTFTTVYCNTCKRVTRYIQFKKYKCSECGEYNNL